MKEFPLPQSIGDLILPNKLSDRDYNVLERYVEAVLRRHRDGTTNANQAREAMMHPLTAFIDEKGPQEFIPYMESHLAEWGK